MKEQKEFKSENQQNEKIAALLYMRLD